jgi:hypothetical protein
MTVHRDPRPPHDPTTSDEDREETARGHGWLMMVCCIPMIMLATVLVATGVVGAGFLFVALMCTVMMAFMMGMMDRERSRL